jgi:hypothetical protein
MIEVPVEAASAVKGEGRTPPDPAVAPQSFDSVDPDDLIWFETVSQAVGTDERSLSVELGFFRIRLRSAEVDEPIVCGCGCARVDTVFVGASLNGLPWFSGTPDSTSARVEFGGGFRARVRFEAAPPRPIIDGRGRIEYALEVFEGPINAVLGLSSRGVVKVEPQWFAIERPMNSPSTDCPPLSGTVKVLVNLALRRLERHRARLERSFPL